MALKTENFFKNQVRISKISIFFATTVSFLLMSTLGLLVINYNSVQTSLKESVTFNLVLSDLLEEKETQQLIKSLSLLEQIKSVNYISKENAATNLIVELGEDFLGVLGYNPLSNMIEVQFFADFITEFNSAKQANFLLDHKEIEDVLCDAAERHVVFRFDKLADFYAHSSQDIQNLMEESALVVIDFNKAIENGFVNLESNLDEAFGQDYPDA